MDFIRIIFIGTAIYTISKIFEKLIKPKSQILKISITLASFILILNQFTLEYLLFPESAVMCFGLFLNVLAVKIMIENPKHKYLKIFILLFLAGISYQGLFNIFPILAMTTYLVKEITEDKPYKEKERFKNRRSLYNVKQKEQRYNANSVSNNNYNFINISRNININVNRPKWNIKQSTRG